MTILLEKELLKNIKTEEDINLALCIQHGDEVADRIMMEYSDRLQNKPEETIQTIINKYILVI